jgi:hypothetical protein
MPFHSEYLLAWRRFMRPIRDRIWPTLPRWQLVQALTAYLEHLLIHRRLPLVAFDPSYSQHLTEMRAGRALFDPLRQITTDKALLRIYVTAKVGDHYNVPTLLVTSQADEASAFVCSETVIAKPTHLSGKMARLAAEDRLPIDIAREWLATDFYRVAREANYRYLRPRIIFEKFLADGGKFPNDYKVHCFFGEPKLIRVIMGRNEDPTEAIYDCDWRPLDFTLRYVRGPSVERPAKLGEMLTVAKKLSAPFQSVRVDLYHVDGRIYVGELTHCPGGGRETFSSRSVNVLLGALARDPSLVPASLFGTGR